MRNVESILESLELKIVKFLAHLDVLKAENQRLKLEIAAQKEKAEGQRATLDKKEADLEALRIANYGAPRGAWTRIASRRWRACRWSRERK